MKKTLLTLLALCLTGFSLAGNILIEGFEYANHDFESPVGWVCNDDSWLSGYLEKDHNRLPHTGNWYAFSNAEESWMFMQLYLTPSLQYRFTCWAISDGNCLLEFWAGTSPSAASMHTLLLSETASSEGYEKISAYIETIPEGCYYIGIRALNGDNATCVTIDDIMVDMVEQYEFEAETITGDTTMMPGSQGVFRFLVHNVGYDELDITMHPSDEFFTNINCFANGTEGLTFHTLPDEVVEVTTYATLRPEVEPGSVAWLDIHMTIPCGCNTAMATFWVTPIETVQTAELQQPEINIFPNPATDFVTIEADGLTAVTLTDLNGKTLSSTAAEGRSVRLDVSGLKPGVYMIVASTRSTSSFVKSILKM